MAPPGAKPSAFRVVDSGNQAHETRLATLRWNQGGRKRVLHRPASGGGKITKSIASTPGVSLIDWQHQEDRRIGMIVADGADGVEAPAGRTCKAHCCHGHATTSSGEWSMARRPQVAGETSPPARIPPPGPRTRRPGGPESRAGWQARWSRSARGPAVETARRNSRTGSRAPRSPAAPPRKSAGRRGYHGDFQRLHLDDAQLGGEAQSALLRHEQQFPRPRHRKSVRSWERFGPRTSECRNPVAARASQLPPQAWRALR